MTTFAEQEQPDLALTEDELVSQWRFDQFLTLGFGVEHASLLAESDADLSRARSLVAVGCPLPVAVQNPRLVTRTRRRQLLPAEHTSSLLVRTDRPESDGSPRSRASANARRAQKKHRKKRKSAFRQAQGDANVRRVSDCGQ